jgi:SAM-dependent methyltransferase
MTCPICGGQRSEVAVEYTARPDGETDFGIEPYRRDYRRCETCGHFFAVMEVDVDYGGDYMDATYADAMEATYARIMALPPERSDNVQRVARIAAALEPATVLDVGSGLGVFPARMKDAGWTVTALDPDPRAAAFTRDHIGVAAVAADFFAADDLGRFALVTFNKVLEHVADPIAMLARTHAFLQPGGSVYVELPDGEAAQDDPDGFGREEFFIEHLHVFSFSSMSVLADRAGFRARRVERLREPSGKYTLWALLAA